MKLVAKKLLKWRVASLGIDSGQRGLALALQDQKEIGVKFPHENALVAILLPATTKSIVNRGFAPWGWRTLTRCGGRISPLPPPRRGTFPLC